MNHTLTRRALSPLVDLLFFVVAWVGLALAIATLLVARAPDNPWGSLAVAVIWGFFGSLGVVGCFESTGRGAGRTVTGLRLRGVDGSALSRRRRFIRAGVKYALVGALAVLAVDLPGAMWVLPFAAFIAANALLIASRRDRRSILDLCVGSRSVAG